MTESFRRKRKSGKSVLEAKFEAQKIAFAPISFQAAKALRDLGILAEIKKTKEDGELVQKIAQNLNISEYGVSTLLEVGAGIGLVYLNDQNKYVLTKTGLFILEDEMTRINLDFVNDVCYQGSFFMQEAIREERAAGLKVFGQWKTIYEGLSKLPKKVQKSWFDFDHYYSDAAFPYALPIVFKNSPKNLFDIGGNTGKWAVSCLDYDKNVTVTIVDLPGQLKKAQENLVAKKLDSRAKFCEADMLDEKTQLPKNADAIWMSQFLDCFSKPQIIQILKKAKMALNQNGSLYILEPFWDKQRFAAAAFSLNHTSLYFTTMANGNSKMYSFNEMIDCINQAGLRLEEAFFNIGENEYTLLRLS